MEKRVIIAILVAIGIAVALLTLALKGVVRISDISGAIVAVMITGIVGILVWGFKPLIEQRFGSREPTQNEREHTKLLTDNVFRRLATISCREIRDHLLDLYVLKIGNLSLLWSPSEPITELNYWGWAESHLKYKKYTGVWTPFSETRTVIAEYNESVSQFISKLRQRLKDEMSDKFPIFVEYNNEDLATENYFHVRHLVDLLYYAIMHYVETSNRVGYNDLRRIYDSNSWRIETDDSHLLLKTPMQHEADKEKLQEVLSSIRDDQNLVEEAKRLYEIRKKIDEPLWQFKEELKELIKKLDGGFTLEGKCELGY